jgi:hypothetical protein
MNAQMKFPMETSDMELRADNLKCHKDSEVTVCKQANKCSRKQWIFINTFQFFLPLKCYGIWLPSSGGRECLISYSSNVLNFSTPTCFGMWLPSSGGRECLISYSSNVLNFSTPTCFDIWLPSSGSRKCLISYSTNVLCYGRVRNTVHTRP